MTNLQVMDLMRLSSNFINETKTLFDAFEAIKKSEFEEVLVVENNFSLLGSIGKDSVKQALKFQLKDSIAEMKKVKLVELDIDYSSPIVLYPKMDIKEAYSLMKHVSKKSLPVLNSPWDKKLIGFLAINDLAVVLEEKYIKITG